MTKAPQLSTILVTGGAGFIGSHLCERLLSLSDLGPRISVSGPSVICLDNFNDFYDPAMKEQNISKIKDHPNFTLIRGDILNFDLLEEIFSGDVFERNKRNERYELNKPRTVIHLAAMAGVRPSLVSPTKYVDVDIKGTLNLLETSKKYEIDQFIFGSSSSVYGVNEKVPFSEEDPTDKQISPYATAKKAAELYCKTYSHLYSIPTTILRFFTVYGPRQRPEMAIHKFTRLITQGKPIPMYGDGNSARDYTYIDDCIDGIITAIKNPFDFEIFNLGNSETVKLRDLINLIANKLGVKPQIEQRPNQPGDVPITYANISKAKELLGYNPKTSIKDGIEKFIRWYLEKSRK